ncbi:acetyltransferase [Histoplasma capsulatum G186AR]|uniref:Acetyltransferase n=1 Tax=Ajellomyces capsulatus TaxID=5037 RepID=A0A8H8D6V4_AJECA|nr:acetyltransferase [Histoplasma capsulatum]QSS69759.1 acetyltransferase [Histoplasma capsulatum G186AR]
MVVWLEFNPTILTLDLGPACQLFSCFLTKQPYTNRALLRFNFCLSSALRPLTQWQNQLREKRCSVVSFIAPSLRTL